MATTCKSLQIILPCGMQINFLCAYNALKIFRFVQGHVLSNNLKDIEPLDLDEKP